MSLGTTAGGLGSGSTLTTLPHTDLLGSLTRAFPSVVDIESASETQSANGEIVYTWSAVYSGVSGILAQNTQGNDEYRPEQMITAERATHVLDLPGYYPAITVEMRAKVTRATGDSAVYYDIIAVRHDSQAQMTRLELETVGY